MNSVYASTARFDSARALSEDEMRRSAPSIFAVSAHESRSERFQPIPTIEVLRALKGIDQDVKLNKALWTLSEKMAELKGLKATA